MPVSVKCSCGRTLRVRDELVGKQVKCPACENVFKAEPEQAQTGPIRVVCDCRATFEAPGHLAGRFVKCPTCQGTVRVPVLDEDSDDSADAYDLSDSSCKECGEELLPGAIFCTHCGTHQKTGEKASVFDSDQPPPPPTQPQALGVPVKPVAAMVAGLIVLAGLYWYFAVYRGRKEGPSGGDRPAPSQQQPGRNSGAAGPASGGAQAQPAGTTGTPAAATPEAMEKVAVKKVGGVDGEWYIERVVYAPQRAKDRMAVLTATDAVKKFKMAEGRSPKNLQEVLDEGYGPFNKPSGDLQMEYDPTKDKVELFRPVRKRR